MNLSRASCTSAYLAAIVLAPLACDAEAVEDASSPVVQFRDFSPAPLEDFVPSCDYAAEPIYHPGYVDRPVECALKAALCVDHLVGPNCAYLDPEDCRANLALCAKQADGCMVDAIAAMEP